MIQKPSLLFMLCCCVVGSALALLGCSNEQVLPSSVPSQTAATELPEADFPEPSITPTPLPLEQSSTPAPLAAQVNGEGILLDEYEAELSRLQGKSGTGLATYDGEKILEDLIDQVLLAQAAVEAGFVADDAMVQTRIQELGLSDQALSEWMTAYGYSEDDLHRVMKRAISATWMRDQIITEVPSTADQVHARQILLYNSGEAEAVYAQLEAGTDFGTLAVEYDSITSGDLGWFPRNYLNVSELDEVLFTLEIGAYSPIIQTPLGYHILQVLERDPNHPLTADARRTLQVQTLRQWLEDQRNQSAIIMLLP